MASAVDKQPAAARLAAVAAARCLPTATRGSQNSYTTSGDTTPDFATLSHFEPPSVDHFGSLWVTLNRLEPE